jgi:hypothetical protein
MGNQSAGKTHLVGQEACQSVQAIAITRFVVGALEGVRTQTRVTDFMTRYLVLTRCDRFCGREGRCKVGLGAPLN